VIVSGIVNLKKEIRAAPPVSSMESRSKHENLERLSAWRNRGSERWHSEQPAGPVTTVGENPAPGILREQAGMPKANRPQMAPFP